MAWNPDLFPSIRSPSLLPVARTPDPITIFIIISRWIDSIGRVIWTIIDRGRNPDQVELTPGIVESYNRNYLRMI